MSDRVLHANDTGRRMFFCPGCQMAHGVDHGWKFNGDFDRPTFEPSILVTYPMWTPPVTPENHEQYKANPWPQTKVEMRCHSFVTNGQIMFLPDCTHPLAGQTVALKPF